MRELKIKGIYKHFKGKQVSRLVSEIFTKEFFSDLLLPFALPLLEGQCSIKQSKNKTKY